jgi:orotate phosphoribosyltransferase
MALGECESVVANDERFIVVEDVVTRGGRVQETINIVWAHSGMASAIGVIVDRSGAKKLKFWLPICQLNRNGR